MNPIEFDKWLQKWAYSQAESAPNPLIMGVLNVTPDSFSDGGQFLNPEKAYYQALSLIEHGADIIDIGGESSRPGAQPVSVDEELARIIPVIKRIRAHKKITISVDTCKAQVMEASLAAGATMINDITALSEPTACEVVAKFNVPVCLMHMKGTPKTMQQAPHYSAPILDEINHFFNQKINQCLKAGIRRDKLILDPGFGFGKTVHHNLEMLNQVKALGIHQLPILLGVSRKSTIGALLQKETHERMVGGLAIAVYAMLNQVAIIRTHDVNETVQARRIIQAIKEIG